MNNKQYLTNMQWLQRALPRIYQKMQIYHQLQAQVPQRVRWQPNKDGQPNVALAQQNRVCFLYSQYNIRRQCETWLDSISDDSIPVIFGLGLGYEAEALLRKKRDAETPIIIIEPDLEVFYYALQRLDFSVFANRRVSLLVDPSVQEMECFLDQFVKREGCIDFQVYPLPGYYYYNQSKIDVCRQAIANTLNRARLTLHTMQMSAKSWEYNQVLNLNHIDHSVSVKALTGLLQGVPAIVASGGPSLDEDMNTLSELYDKAVIVPVGSALSALDVHAVRAHMVLSVDGNPAQADIFRDIRYNRDIFLFYAAMVHYEVPTLFRDEAFYFPLMQFDYYIHQKLNREYIPVDMGYTVAASAIDLLAQLGCSPIILCGQDLCYAKNQSHATGAKYYLENMRERLESSNTLVSVVNKRGEPVDTRLVFLGMRNRIENIIQRYPQVQFLNCSRYGLPIQGAMDAELQQIKETLLTQSFDIADRLQSAYDLHISSRQGLEIENIRLDIECQCSQIVRITDHLIELVSAKGYARNVRALAKEVAKLEDELMRLNFYADALLKPYRIFMINARQVQLDSLGPVEAGCEKLALDIERKKRFYCYIFDLAKTIVKAASESERVIAAARRANGWYAR